MTAVQQKYRSKTSEDVRLFVVVLAFVVVHVQNFKDSKQRHCQRRFDLHIENTQFHLEHNKYFILPKM